MNFELVNNIPLLKMDFTTTITLAILLLLFGNWLRKKFTVLNKYCIPAAVLGGFGFAILAAALKSGNVMLFKMDTILQTPLQLAFFTAVGIGGSLSLLKKGGKLFIIYLVACWATAIFQNGIGVVLAKALGVHPLLGVMSGAVALEGGPANAAAFGPMAESFGVTGATAVGIASATYGIIAGGILGGPVAKWLIERHKVKIEADDSQELQELQNSINEQKQEKVTSSDVISMLAMILTMMVLGALLSSKLKAATGFDLPGYVGGMFMAVLFRNINDIKPIIKMNYAAIDLIGDVCLGLFLTLAMMSLKIWELYSLALPLMIMLIVQTIVMVLYCLWPLFQVLGKNYDAAVMCSGMLGHGLGVTANAVADMDAVCKRYGVYSPKAFINVPLCGAVLVDIVGIPCIVWFINFFGR